MTGYKALIFHHDSAGLHIARLVKNSEAAGKFCFTLLALFVNSKFKQSIWLRKSMLPERYKRSKLTIANTSNKFILYQCFTTNVKNLQKEKNNLNFYALHPIGKKYGILFYF